VQRDPGIIDFVLLSHHHGDHFGGVPFLFMEYLYEEPRRSSSCCATSSAMRPPSARST
jgi:metal-dependent hydrolase (beta-lactamase superfamily II)